MNNCNICQHANINNMIFDIILSASYNGIVKVLKLLDTQNNALVGTHCPFCGELPPKINEPRHEKTGFLHMRKQRRRSASR